MAESPEDPKNAGKRNFLKNSRWGKVLRERSGSDNAGTSFKLNHDVTDFLKPSTEKGAAVRAEEGGAAGANATLAPKIDVAIAQRFPDAGQVRELHERQTQDKRDEENGWGWGPNGWRKPKRRKGLQVGFVSVAPLVIGEGGDECEVATAEIGRAKEQALQRAKTRARSSSNRKPVPPVVAEPPPPQSAPTQSRAEAMGALEGGQGDGFGSDALRRMPAPGQEFGERSEPVAIPRERVPSTLAPKRGSILSSPDELNNCSPITPADEVLHLPQMVLPQITTHLAPDMPPQNPPPGAASRPRSKSPSDALSVRKRELRSGEGAAFRRASALIMDDNHEEEERRTSFNQGFRPSEEVYDALSREDAPGFMSQTSAEPEDSPSTSPGSPDSFDEPSPFADPKYMSNKVPSRDITPQSRSPLPTPRASQALPRGQRFSRDVTPESRPPLPVPRASQVGSRLAQPAPGNRSPPRAAPPPQQQPPQARESSLRPDRVDSQPSYIRAAQRAPSQEPPEPRQPTLPQISVPEPAENSRPTPRNEPPSYMRPSPNVQTDTQSNGPTPPTIQTPDSPILEPAKPSVAKRSSLYDVFDQFPSFSSNNEGGSAGSSQPRSGSRSPFRDRLFGSNTHRDSVSHLYSKHNASSGSLNHFPTFAPGLRSGSQDEPQPQDPSRYARSPYSTGYDEFFSASQDTAAADHADYFSISKATSQDQPAKSPGHQLRSEANASSRTSSAESHRSQQRPRQESAPMTSSHRSTASGLRQEEQRRPSSSGSSATAMPHRSSDQSTGSKPQQIPASKNAAPQPRPEEMQTPMSLSAGSPWTAGRPGISPQLLLAGDPQADLAFADFAGRVAHMKGVFRLAAEKEQQADRCEPKAWLRNATWWYLKGKHGLEALRESRPRSTESPPQELLTQPHVDLAKTWWILEEPLAEHDPVDEDLSLSISAADPPEVVLKQSVAALKKHVKMLSLSMSKLQLMPPHQSLIQGQDIRIWLDYPRLPADVTAALTGASGASVEESKQIKHPREALPLGDSKEAFCYTRCPVEVSINQADSEGGQETFPCIVTTMREKRDFLTSFVLASQSDLVNLRLGPRHGSRKGLEWRDVSWKASSSSMTIRLGHGVDVSVRMSERDFRSFWNLAEYSRKIEHSLRSERGEKLVHEVRLAELQHADSSGSNVFPSEKLRRCKALIFERLAEQTDSSGTRAIHCGYRLLLTTDATHKSLSSVSHTIGRRDPLYYEFITDSAAQGMAAMVVRVREEQRQCRILLVFPDVTSRQTFYDTLNGLTVRPDEAIVSKTALSTLNIEPATQIDGFSSTIHPALRALEWQRLGITNTLPTSPRTPSSLVASDSLRIIARHATGCITDRLNLPKGELLLRLPCAPTPTLQLLRAPQQDITLSIDTRHAPDPLPRAVADLAHMTARQPTIRSYTFASIPDLHAFQTALTGHAVRYDAFAATFAIARRRAVVPLYKKREAASVRVQIVVAPGGGFVQLLAFMEDFALADALCFQVKSTDSFELVKGEGKKGGKFGVKLVDAKFTLPEREKEKEREREGEGGGEGALAFGREGALEEKVRGRFVNLEGLVYAEEHDDVTVGFDSAEERDRFAEALPSPATASASRGLTLKRRT